MTLSDAALPGPPDQAGAGHSAIVYRPEIDGLRAIAVLVVVFYHADFWAAGQRLFGGGFLGVDVFFVISGYLITSILLRAEAAGLRSLPDFYLRRVLRIFPALALVLVGNHVHELPMKKCRGPI